MLKVFAKAIPGLLCCALLGSSGGCRSADEVPGFVTRDSAGVEVAENRLPGILPQLSAVRHGFTRPDSGPGEPVRLDLEFGVPVHIAALSSGMIVVSDGDAIEVRGADGRLVRRYGRTGEGPGEFLRIASLCVTRGDTLVVFDAGPTRRVSIVTPDGVLVRSFRITGTVPRDACFDDGTFVVLRPARNNAVEPRDSVVRVNVRGEDMAVLLIVRGSEYSSGIWRETSILAQGNSLIVGDATGDHIRYYNQSGTLLRIVQCGYATERVTKAEAAAALRAATPIGLPPAVARMIAGQARRRRGGAPWPYYGRIVDLGDGGLLVQDYPKPTDRTRSWRVLDTNGMVVGVVEFGLKGSATYITPMKGNGNDVFVRYDDLDGFTYLDLVTIARDARTLPLRR